MNTITIQAVPTAETAARWRDAIDRGGDCAGCGAKWVNRNGAYMEHRMSCVLLTVEDHQVGSLDSDPQTVAEYDAEITKRMRSLHYAGMKRSLFPDSWAEVDKLCDERDALLASDRVAGRL